MKHFCFRTDNETEYQRYFIFKIIVSCQQKILLSDLYTRKPGKLNMDLPKYQPKMSAKMWLFEVIVIVVIVAGIVSCFIRWHLGNKERERKSSKNEGIRCEYCK